MAASPITVAIERDVDPELADYARSWVQQGIGLAQERPGFLGAGWIQEEPGSHTWHMLYRFDTAAHLDAWETSAERKLWLESGAQFASESKIDRRTGIEGWFDSVEGEGMPGDRVEIRAAEPIPPRWKQAVVVWSAFFPMNLAFTFLLGLIPGFTEWPLVARILTSTVLLTPVMVVWVLPLVTRAARPWLLRGRRE